MNTRLLLENIPEQVNAIKDKTKDITNEGNLNVAVGMKEENIANMLPDNDKKQLAKLDFSKIATLEDKQPQKVKLAITPTNSDRLKSQTLGFFPN